VPSQAEFQCECAFAYMNAVFRKNLTDALVVDANDVDTASNTGGALDDGTGQSAVLPDECDIHLGRERPLELKHGAVSEGWQRGSLTPPDASITAADSRADCDTGGKERRPIDRGEVADRKEHRHVTHRRNHVPLEVR
jgi:hypothetical protein